MRAVAVPIYVHVGHLALKNLQATQSCDIGSGPFTVPVLEQRVTDADGLHTELFLVFRGECS